MLMDDIHRTLLPTRHNVLAALVVASAWHLAMPAVSASGGCCGLRPQDQLWLVSDRGLGCASNCETPRLKFWRYNCQQHWTRAELDELLAAESPRMTTVVYVHGNRLSASEAFERAWTSYRALARRADERPIRYIAWSWPSEKSGGPLQDARAKAARTDTTSYYLAWFVDRLDPNTPLSLWAHSFGARATTGALHLLGGGQLRGQVLERVHPERTPVNVVLLASALDSHWILPGRFHGQALTMTSHMLLVNNCADRLLKHYELISGWRSGHIALGHLGINRRALGPQASKVTQIDASNQVGNRHLFELYMRSAGLMARIRSILLSAPAGVYSADLAPIAEGVSPSSPTPDDASGKDTELELVTAVGTLFADDLTADDLTVNGSAANGSVAAQ